MMQRERFQVCEREKYDAMRGKGRTELYKTCMYLGMWKKLEERKTLRKANDKKKNTCKGEM